MKDNMPMISVIIPVYNVEQYLRQCLDSVVNQTYNNLEVILVDDGSTDLSGSICDEYARKDSRIRVRHKENQGVSHTRNIGIDMAQGEYIMFVDSDDWVEPDICSALIKAMQDYTAQSAMCSYVREYPGNPIPKIIMPEDRLFTGKEIQRRLCGPIGEELRHPENIECLNSLWGRLYPAAALDGKRIVDIKEIGSSEDLLFNFDVFSGIETMIYINRPLYHYRKGMEQSVTTGYRPQLNQQWDRLYSRMEEIMKANQLDENFYVGFQNRLALNTLALSLNSVMDTATWSVKCKRLSAVLENPRREKALKCLSLKHMPFYWKIFYFSAKHKITWLLCILSVLIMKLKGKV